MSDQAQDKFSFVNTVMSEYANAHVPGLATSAPLPADGADTKRLDWLDSAGVVELETLTEAKRQGKPLRPVIDALRAFGEDFTRRTSPGSAHP